MKGQTRRQLVLDLEHEERVQPAVPRPEALVQALADLLLEALGAQASQSNATGGVDDSEDHA